MKEGGGRESWEVGVRQVQVEVGQNLMGTGSHCDAIMLVINPAVVCVSGWADTRRLEGVNGKSMRGMCL